MALAGYLNSVWLGGVSVFFVLLMCQRFFGDGSYAIIGPYIAEVWPARLRASGMGLGYGVGNLGKIIGPLGLALIIGSSNYVSPKATLDAIVPAFLFLAFWYALAATAFWLVGVRDQGTLDRGDRRVVDSNRGSEGVGCAVRHRRYLPRVVKRFTRARCRMVMLEATTTTQPA